MSYLDIIMPARSTRVLPEVRRISLTDIKEALAKGLDDFWAMPTHVVFLSLIYPVIGFLLCNTTFDYDGIPLLYPLASAPKGRRYAADFPAAIFFPTAEEEDR